MDEILDTPVITEKHFQYAGFWIRVGAYFIDAIILLIVNIILSYILFGGYNPMVPNYTLSGISLLINAGYFCVLESSARQATFGKMVVGIKVGDLNGDRISVGNAIGRYFAKILSAVILCIGFLLAGWDSKTHALHDTLANTYVYYV